MCGTHHFLPPSLLVNIPIPPVPPSQSAQEPALKRPTAVRLAQFAASLENSVQVLRPVQAILDAVMEQFRREQQAAAEAVVAASAASASAACFVNNPKDTRIPAGSRPKDSQQLKL